MKKFLQITMISMLMVSGYGLQGMDKGIDENSEEYLTEHLRYLNQEIQEHEDFISQFNVSEELPRSLSNQDRFIKILKEDKLLTEAKLTKAKSGGQVDLSQTGVVDPVIVSEIPVVGDGDTPEGENGMPQPSATSNWYDVVTSTPAKISAALVAIVGAVASVWYYNQPAEHTPVMKYTDADLQDGKEYSDNQIADESDQQ